MKGAPRSEQFDDVYFSVDNGFAETQHVFLQGNNLPAAWQGKQRFTIAETGFGTGLNFLCTWKLFTENSKPGQFLDFVSFEKFPLSYDEISQALVPWKEELDQFTAKLIKHYPIRVGGFHRIVFDEHVALTLIFGDVNDYLPQLRACVDCWFLDGFTPSKNPEMWSETLYSEMARLSHGDTRFATFTAAGDVRRGLECAGFFVEKKPGFGKKRDMIVGHFSYPEKRAHSNIYRNKKNVKKVAIIGGGLAGTACAYALRQYGMKTAIYEKEDILGAGASGNDVGLYNPRFSALWEAEALYYSSAYAHAVRIAKISGDAADCNPCGTLHLITNESRKKRYQKMLSQWPWHRDHMQKLSSDEASAVAGIDIDSEAVFLPDAGSISPKKLCHYFARDSDMHFGQNICDLDDLDCDAIILAHAINMIDFIPELPIYTVRGQITHIKNISNECLENLKTNLCYDGFISASHDNFFTLGSTFQRDVGHVDVLDQDHYQNIEAFCSVFPNDLKEGFDIVGGRSGLRVTSRDHFPVIGQVLGDKPIYYAGAFGSYGLVGSIAAAHLLADIIRNGPWSQPKKVVNALSAKRFLDRAIKKHIGPNKS